MKIFSEFKKVVEILQEYNGSWAVCGGVAASIYRKESRFTNDIDIALIDHNGTSAEQIALEITKKLGYKEIIGFLPDIHNPNQQIKGLICCRNDNNESFIGIDFLLPIIPWIEKAVTTAQDNKVDYGFELIATITPEDLIIAKLIALKNTPNRKYDEDDIIEILKSQKLNIDYINEQILTYKLDLSLDMKEKLKSNTERL